MAQVFRCDICGKTEESASRPPKWGTFHRPLTYAVPAQQAEAERQRLNKDLCEDCSFSLGQLLDELRRRLQKKFEETLARDRQDVVKALLASGKEEP